MFGFGKGLGKVVVLVGVEGGETGFGLDLIERRCMAEWFGGLG